MTTSQPNLLGAVPRVSRKVRMLQGGIAIMLAVIGGLSWQMLWGDLSGRGQKAAIVELSEIASRSQPGSAPDRGRVPKPVSTDAIVSLAIGAAGNTLRYYEAKTGRAFSYSPTSGRTETLSEEKLSGFVRSYWLPGSQRVVSVFDDKGVPKYRAYDYATGVAVPIGNAVTALAVASDGKQIVFADAHGGMATLYRADAGGTAPVKLMDTRASSLQLSWPTGDKVMVASRRADSAGWDLTSVSKNGAIAAVLTGKENLEYAWSADGTMLLYSHFVSEDGITLHLRNIKTGADTSLGIATSARKCAWAPDGESVVCGIPARTQLARDIPTDLMATTDNIVRVDLVFGAVQDLYTVPGGTLLGIIDPVISPSGDFFAFQNLFDKRLYVYDLR